jgi:hypothetical protein
MPTVTLANLEDYVYSTLEQNNLFYPAAEVDSCINDAIRILNLFTGFLNNTATVAAIKTASIYSVPAGILIPTKVMFGTRTLEKSSVTKISMAYPCWMNETAADAGIPVSYWFPIGVTKFGIYPRPAANGTNLSVTGVAEPDLLTTGASTIAYPTEFADILEVYAEHAVQLKAAGVVAKASMSAYQDFLGRMNELKRYKAKIAPRFTVLVEQEK